MRTTLVIVAVWAAVAVPVAVVLGRILAGAPCDTEPCELCGDPVCVRRVAP